MINALRQRPAKDAKGAAYWNRQIEEDSRQLVDMLNSLVSMGLPAENQRPRPKF